MLEINEFCFPVLCAMYRFMCVNRYSPDIHVHNIIYHCMLCRCFLSSFFIANIYELMRIFIIWICDYSIKI